VRFGFVVLAGARVGLASLRRTRPGADTEDMMKIAIGAAFTILAASLVSACSASAPPATVPPASHGTGANGLTAARYSQCDQGALIMQYLVSGDNQGNPDLDKNFGTYVGATGPRARAIADAAIEQCNKQGDDDAAAQATAQASAQAQASANAQTAQDDHLATVQQQSCAAIGGTINMFALVSNNRCRSATPDAPSGPSNTLCAYGDIYFNDDGSISQSSYNDSKQNYPGCFK